MVERPDQLIIRGGAGSIPVRVTIRILFFVTFVNQVKQQKQQKEYVHLQLDSAFVYMFDLIVFFFFLSPRLFGLRKLGRRAWL